QRQLAARRDHAAQPRLHRDPGETLRLEAHVRHAPADDLLEGVRIVGREDGDTDEREVAGRGRRGREHRPPTEAMDRGHRGAQLASGRHRAGVPIAMSDAPAARYSRASAALRMPPTPITGIPSCSATLSVASTPIGSNAGPLTPPDPLASR